MVLLRIVIQKPEGKPYADLGVALHRTEPTEPDTSPLGQGITDEGGVVRFWVEPGTFQIQFKQIPEGMHPPRHSTTVRLEDFAEGMEQVIRLVKAD